MLPLLYAFLNVSKTGKFLSKEHLKDNYAMKRQDKLLKARFTICK